MTVMESIEKLKDLPFFLALYAELIISQRFHRKTNRLYILTVISAP